MTPLKFGNKVELWREWQEDVRSYIDSNKPGMRELLLALEKEKEPQGKDFVEQEYPLLAEESTVLWRTLKHLTEDGSEARRVTTGVNEEDGFMAWTKLHQQYGQQLAAKQGTVRSKFYGLVGPRKSPADTRSHLVEVDRMAKMVYEVTGRQVTDDELKGVIIGCLDPITKQHTARLHGTDVSAKELRAVVNSYINNVVTDSDAMQLGSFAKNGEEEEEEYAEGTDMEELNAMKGKGKGKGKQCFNCGGYGHVAAECP